MKEVTNQECVSVSKINFGKLSTSVASTFLQQQENVPPTCPLPKLAWANSQEVWRNMREKERVTNHPDHLLRTSHPGLTSHMRAILLEWMMEVKLMICLLCVNMLWMLVYRCVKYTSYKERPSTLPLTCMKGSWLLTPTFTRNIYKRLE